MKTLLKTLQIRHCDLSPRLVTSTLFSVELFEVVFLTVSRVYKDIFLLTTSNVNVVKQYLMKSWAREREGWGGEVNGDKFSTLAFCLSISCLKGFSAGGRKDSAPLSHTTPPPSSTPLSHPTLPPSENFFRIIGSLILDNVKDFGEMAYFEG